MTLVRTLFKLLLQLFLLTVPGPLVDLLAAQVHYVSQLLDVVDGPVGILLEFSLQELFLLVGHPSSTQLFLAPDLRLSDTVLRGRSILRDHANPLQNLSGSEVSNLSHRQLVLLQHFEVN